MAREIRRQPEREEQMPPKLAHFNPDDWADDDTDDASLLAADYGKARMREIGRHHRHREARLAWLAAHPTHPDALWFHRNPNRKAH